MKQWTLFSVISFVVVLIHLPSSFQDCDRPTNLQDNVVIDPDLPSYGLYNPPYTASCEAGYDVAGPTLFYCSSKFDGTTPDYWDPDPSLTTCNAAPQCSRPNITDTNVVITPDKDLYDVFEVVTFNCSNEGYTIVGPDDATCEDDGEFNLASQPTCAAGCSVPAYSNGTGSYENGDEATFSCAEGYVLVAKDNSLKSTCEDGDWNPEVVCQEPAGCYPPANRVNVNFTTDVDLESDGTYPTYTKLDMACAGQRSPWGPEYSYCNTSRQWEPDPEILVCYEKCARPSFADPDLILTSELSDSSDELTYYDHTDTVTFSCPGDVYVDGPWRASCNDGTWSTPIGGYRPVCRANCTAPDNTLNAGELFQHGQAYTFQCDPTIQGLVRLGGPTAFCNDGTWKPNLTCRLKTEL